MKNMKENGFTLVELAIVLMIIGLLIGGILRGQELMENSRVSSTIQQVLAYQGAMVTFQDSYAMLPGDIVTATTRLPGCTAANDCRNGDGNGIIGTMGQSYPWANISSAVATENTQFWKHLAAAHLISGVNPGALTPEWGDTHPIAKIGGGFFMRASTWRGTTMDMPMQGHYLLLRRNISGNWDCGIASPATSRGLCSVAPVRASQIDRKMDDGIAYAGEVLAVSANSTTGCGFNDQGENGPNGYAEGKTGRACDMMFRFY